MEMGLYTREHQHLHSVTTSISPKQFNVLKPLGYSLLGLGSIIYYLRYAAPRVADFYFEGVTSPYFHFAVVLLLAVLTLTAVGCSIHLKIIGGFERSDLESDVEREISQLKTLQEEATEFVKLIENQLPEHGARQTARFDEPLSVLKLILLALDRRITSVSELLKSGSMSELSDAAQVLRMKLHITESAQRSLIDVDPFPAITPENIERIIRNLMKEVQTSFRLAA